MKREYITPSGAFPALYDDMSKQSHLLLAGATGSGKSTVINGIIYRLLYHSPAAVQLALIDIKRVELIDYSRLPHCIEYSDTIPGAIATLNNTIAIIEKRFKAMQSMHLKLFPGPDLYLVIDELADLMTVTPRVITPLLQRITQIGRAARVHAIAATQCPISTVIPTPIKANFPARVALKTATGQDSRNIIGIRGCENFPDPVTDKIAYAYYMHGTGIDLYKLPLIPPEELNRLISYWQGPRGKSRLKLFR